MTIATAPIWLRSFQMWPVPWSCRSPYKISKSKYLYFQLHQITKRKYLIKSAHREVHFKCARAHYAIIRAYFIVVRSVRAADLKWRSVHAPDAWRAAIRDVVTDMPVILVDGIGLVVPAIKKVLNVRQPIHFVKTCTTKAFYHSYLIQYKF